MKPYINAAIIGNGRMLATLGSDGEINRLFWPDIDLTQNVNVSWAALSAPVLGETAQRIHDTDTWSHSQEYLPDSPILQTESISHNKKVSVTIFDFVALEKDILIRVFEVRNRSEAPTPAVLLYYNSLHIDQSPEFNTTIFDEGSDVMFHYRRGKWFAVAGTLPPFSYQCGGSGEEVLVRRLNGDDSAMAPQACQAWDLGVIQPGAVSTMAVFITAGADRQEVFDNITFAREQGWNSFLQETRQFWADYLSRGYKLQTSNAEIQHIFRKSVMVCKLLMNQDTGGIIAAPEFDEHFTRCGGYGYCWSRDGVYIAHAMLKAGYPDYARAFYRWASKFQRPSGGWPQRHYTNGTLAPVWGDQLDEPGTVLWGIYNYYKETGDKDFLKELWPTVNKGAEFLLKSINSEIGLVNLSYDLWEERFGEHLYSAAAVSAGLEGAAEIARLLGIDLDAGRFMKAALTLREKLLDYFWDNETGQFLRSGWRRVSTEEFLWRKTENLPVKKAPRPKRYHYHLAFGDPTPDVSLIGLTIPFNLVPPDDIRMKRTVETLQQSLGNFPVGGIGRYQNDCYIGGNPWVLVTLWMGLFECAAGQWDKAAARLNWAVKYQTSLGLLPEQVDKITGEPAWAVPLTWSHAMFLWLAVVLSEAKQL